MAPLPPPFRQKIGDGSLGWGLIGTGRVAAGQMIPAIRNQPPAPGSDPTVTGSWAVGVYSHSERRAKQFADTHQIPHAFVNLSDLLTHHAIHCVYVANHPRHHAQSVMAALAAGKHVLCETPLALSLTDAHTMAQMATERGLHLGVNFVRRADPAIQTLRTLLRDGAIGDLLGGRISNTALLETNMQTWRLQPNGGGVIVDRTLHDLDLLRYLLRDEVDSLLAAETGKTLGSQVEEDLLAHVHMTRSALTVQLHDSFIIPHARTSIEFFGSSGTLTVEDCFVDDFDSRVSLTRNRVATSIPTPNDNPFRQMVQCFLESVRDGRPLLASARDGVVSLASELAIRESMPYARTVRVDHPSRLI